MRALLAAAWLCLSASAWAQPAPPPQPAPVMPSPVTARVDVEVMVIEASEAAGPSDPRLTPLLATLNATGFASFQLVDRRSLRVADSETQQLLMSDARVLTIQMLSHDLQQAQVRLVLVSGAARLVDTTITVHRNKAFYLAVRGHAGKSMIIPVAVRY
jgi:hypothetical protein